MPRGPGLGASYPWLHSTSVPFHGCGTSIWKLAPPIWPVKLWTADACAGPAVSHRDTTRPATARTEILLRIALLLSLLSGGACEQPPGPSYFGPERNGTA